MLFTRETDYALRFFRELADGNQHSVGEITQNQLIPKQFAYKILRKLSKANLVRVTRGTKGGCTLNTDLSQTTLYDIMEIIEAKSFLVACMGEGFVCPYRESQMGVCNIHNNLIDVERNLISELKNHSIEDMIRVHS